MSALLPTDDAIDNMSTATLRAGAIKLGLADYLTRRTVASFDLSDEVINHGGAFNAIENVLKVLKVAYKEGEPVVRRDYGMTLALQVWQDDDTLRSYLKREVAKRREADAEATA